MAELEIRIEKLREKLNEFMVNREAYDYNDILSLSIELDKLIYYYYTLINNENKKKCTE